MSDSTKMREYWITRSLRAYERESDLLPSDIIRVHAIEYAAYTQAIQRAEAADFELASMKHCYKLLELERERVTAQLSTALTELERVRGAAKYGPDVDGDAEVILD